MVGRTKKDDFGLRGVNRSGTAPAPLAGPPAIPRAQPRDREALMERARTPRRRPLEAERPDATARLDPRETALARRGGPRRRAAHSRRPRDNQATCPQGGQRARY